MRATVLFGLLLIHLIAANPVKEANAGDYGFTPLDIELLTGAGLYMYDDDQRLVPLTAEIDYDEETDEELKLDLENRVFFNLYTSKNVNKPQPLYIDDEEALQKSFFDGKKPTRIVTHGWVNSARSPSCKSIRDAYLKHGDYNVIVIDWSKISFRPYIWASSKVLLVGKHVAKMIDFLEKHGMDLSETNMIGHSLGAHVVGLAGHYAQGKVNYIVGMDPALPGFLLAGPGARIASGDAYHVEIIHTNAGLLGYAAAIGDSDFYPNGGSKQLGCLIDIGGACSHCRSYQFFAESINSQVGFYGKSCTSFLEYMMGLCKHKDSSIMGEQKRLFGARGTYYLSTKSYSPFAKGP